MVPISVLKNPLGVDMPFNNPNQSIMYYLFLVSIIVSQNVK